MSFEKEMSEKNIRNLFWFIQIFFSDFLQKFNIFPLKIKYKNLRKSVEFVWWKERAIFVWKYFIVQYFSAIDESIPLTHYVEPYEWRKWLFN